MAEFLTTIPSLLLMTIFFIAAVALVLLDYLLPVDYLAYLGYLCFAIGMFFALPMGLLASIVVAIAIFLVLLFFHVRLFSHYLTNAGVTNRRVASPGFLLALVTRYRFPLP